MKDYFPLEYTSNNEQANLAVMRAINEIVWWEQMRALMPMVVKELVKAGVKFPPNLERKSEK